MPQRIAPYVIYCADEEIQDGDHHSEKDIDLDFNPSMQQLPVKFHLSLCGCGFLGIYHLGAASCLVRHGVPLLQKVDRVVGASAGALVASVLVIRKDKLTDCIKFTHDLAAELRSKPAGALTPGYNLMKPLEKFLEKWLPEDAHVRASGKLYISLTNIKTRKNEIFSQFEDRQELKKCLLASSYIPLYGGVKPPKIRGKRYIDGGFTNNLPVFEDGFTVRMSPFCGGQEIAPKDKTGLGFFFNVHSQDFQVNLHNVTRGLHAFFPPTKETLSKYFNRGYHDAERYLRSNRLFKESCSDFGTVSKTNGANSEKKIFMYKETSV